MDKLFPGFPSSLEKASWQFPTVINGYANTLSGAEFKVLWYILRHTYGWQKNFDKLSITQISEGITKKDGTILDKGTGLSRRWVIKSLRSLEEKGFIKIIKEAGKVSKIFPNITGEESSPLPVTQSSPVASEESSPTINNIPITNTNIISKDITKPLGFGNSDINFLISYLKEKLSLPLLDNSEKQNRRYAHLAIKKFGGVDKVRLLIDTTAQNSFWATKITSFQQLYYKAVQIISSTRQGGVVNASGVK